MKTIKILILVLFASLSSYAQDPDPILFDTEWFLLELTVDGEMISIPDNGQIDDVTLNFNEDGIYIIPCNSYNCETADFSDTSFTIISSVIFDDDCFLPDTILFEGIYIYEFFLLSTNDHIFGYVLESGTNDTFMLTITNDVGDTAVYGNAQLGVQYFDNLSFTLYPNPVKDELFISSKSNLNDFNIIIYSISGRSILSLNNSKLRDYSIDLQELKSGIYFIQIKGKQGQSATKKFIKN